MLQTTGHKITRSTSHIQSQIALKIFGTSRIDLVLDVQRRLNISKGERGGSSCWAVSVCVLGKAPHPLTLSLPLPVEGPMLHTPPLFTAARDRPRERGTWEWIWLYMDVQSVCARSGPDRCQIKSRSSPDRCQIKSRSGPDQVQIKAHLCQHVSGKAQDR